MTFIDLIHAILMLIGLCAGLGIGIHQGLTRAILGAGVGLLVGHLVGVSLAVGDLFVHGIARRWSRTGKGVREGPF